MSKSERKKKMRLIPWSWRRMINGLSGDASKRAEIEYYYEGYDREWLLIEHDYKDDWNTAEKKLLELQLRHGEITQYQYDTESINLDQTLTEDQKKKKLYDVMHFHGQITPKEYEKKKAQFIEDETERQLTLLDIQLKYGQITQLEHEKQTKQIKNEPWVIMKDFDFKTKDGINPQRGAFELDWNEAFIELISEHGYAAPTEEEAVNSWLSDVARLIALEEFDGIGDWNDILGNADDVIETKQIDKDRYSKG